MRNEDEVALDAEVMKQTQLKWQADGVNYCPDMGNNILPSYIPAYYKQGISGERSQAEHLQASKLKDKVCKTCRDGPRCKVDNWNKTGRTISDGNQCKDKSRRYQSDSV